MKTMTTVFVVLAALLIVGAVFVSAEVAQESEAQEEAPSVCQVSPSQCGVGSCDGQCGGSCGVASCSIASNTAYLSGDASPSASALETRRVAAAGPSTNAAINRERSCRSRVKLEISSVSSECVALCSTWSDSDS